jgi:hypothetical protein
MAQPKALWSEIDGEPWLDNPRKKRRHRRNRMPAGLARYWRTHRRGGKSRRHRRNPESHRTRVAAARKGWRRRGRRHRRNPFMGGRGGMFSAVKRGIIGGTGVVLGKAASRAIPTLVNLPRTGVLGAAIQGATGVLLAPFVTKFMGGEWGTAFLYGAFAAPIESLIVGFKVPVLAPALSSYPDELAALPSRGGTPSLEAYSGSGMLDEESAFVQ